MNFGRIFLMKNTLKKIKTFFKKRKKIFKPILFYVGSIFSLIPIACIVGIIVTGGVSNFTERIKFEYIVWKDDHSLCSKPSWIYSGYGEYSKFYWKANTQFIDYFKYKPYSVVKKVVGLKDETLYNFELCAAIRYLLKAAHQDSKIAKVILASFPVPRSLAVTLIIPFASISNFTLICGTPLGAGGISVRIKLPSDTLSAAIGLSP